MTVLGNLWDAWSMKLLYLHDSYPLSVYLQRFFLFLYKMINFSHEINSTNWTRRKKDYDWIFLQKSGRRDVWFRSGRRRVWLRPEWDGHRLQRAKRLLRLLLHCRLRMELHFGRAISLVFMRYLVILFSKYTKTTTFPLSIENCQKIMIFGLLIDESRYLSF